MMAVSHDEVRRMAALARLVIDDARIPTLAHELSSILGHMEVLRQATGEPVEGRWRGDHGGSAVTARPDAVDPAPIIVSPAMFAPAVCDGFFLVPRLSTHEPAGASGDPRDPA